MEIFQPEGEVITSIFPITIILTPLLGSFVVFLIGLKSEKYRDISSVVLTGTTFGLILSMYPMVSAGKLEYGIDWFQNLTILFQVSNLGYLFIILMSLIWFLATLYATEYISHEHNRNRFYFFWLFTLGGTLGVFMTGEMLGLFVFFEMATFSSYVLVIHEEDDDAMKAGKLFLFLGVIGGLLILMAMFLLYSAIGTLDLVPMLDEIQASGVNIPVLLTLFTIGFGIKAGIVPLHIWLPKAHPVAPTPASALLSGLLIKTGVYGILQVYLMLTPPGVTQDFSNIMSLTINYGGVLIWIGIITMFLGAIMALLQTSAKKILAYSSVSQVGFIVVGIGCAAYLGFEGPIGFAGALMHVINHALFKACLFLVVGAIFIRTHLLDIDRVRGMFKQMPFVGIAFIVAALGIAGVPLFNGYASKTLIHHALVDVYQLNDSTGFYIAERIFTLTSALTVTYFIKLFRGLFLGPLPDEWKTKDLTVAPIIKVVLTVFMVLIILIGVFPNFVLENMIVPTMAGASFSHAAVSEQLLDVNFWYPKDIQKVGIVFFIAIALTLAGNKFGWFRITPPAWMSVERVVYQPLVTGLLLASEKLGATFDVSVNTFFETTSEQSLKLCRKISKIDRNIDETYQWSGDQAKHMANRISKFERDLDDMYQDGSKQMKKIAKKGEIFDQELDKSYEQPVKRLILVRGKGHLSKSRTVQSSELEDAYMRSGRVSHYVSRKQKKNKGILDRLKIDVNNFNIKNLNFDSFIVIIMLGISLLILVLYR